MRLRRIERDRGAGRQRLRAVKTCRNTLGQINLLPAGLSRANGKNKING
jgi:hypothetical protein